MSMEKKAYEGSLSGTPFPFLLFSLWKAKKTGWLRIGNKPYTRHLFFKNGELVITNKNITDEALKRSLLKKKLISTPELEKLEDSQAQNKNSLIKALTELGFLSSGHIWELMEDIFRTDVYPIFDWNGGKYELDLEQAQPEHINFHYISVLKLIMQGIRQMKNFGLLQVHLPPEAEILQVRFPDYTSQIRFESPEIYISGLFEQPKTTKASFEASELSKKETQRIIYSLYCLELLIPSKVDSKNSYPEKTFPTEMSKIVNAFNKKCSYIFKYVSKEIGPVAMNVMEKCLEEAKINLSPLFKEIRLGKNGIIETTPSLIGNFRSQDEETKQNLIYGLNEILASEVLAVKRTLGNKHESILVKNLEKIGE
jgi:hypothetical protein